MERQEAGVNLTLSLPVHAHMLVRDTLSNTARSFLFDRLYMVISVAHFLVMHNLSKPHCYDV